MVLTVLWCVLQLWCFILYVRTESEAIATSARVFAEQWLPWIVPYGMARLLGSFVPAAATGSQDSEIPMSSQNALEVTFGESTLSNQTAPETVFFPPPAAPAPRAPSPRLSTPPPQGSAYSVVQSTVWNGLCHLACDPRVIEQFGVAGPAVLMLSVFVRKLQARGA